MSELTEQTLLRKLQRLAKGDSLRARLLRGGAGSLIVKSLNAVIAFLLAITLARTLGAEGFGVYSFILTLITLLAIPAQVGVPQVVIRETAKAQSAQHWGRLRGLWKWANRYVLMFSLVLMACAIALLFLRPSWLYEDRWNALFAGMLLIPVIALANVRAGALRGLRHIVIGLLPEKIIKPALTLVLILLVSIFSYSHFPIEPWFALVLHMGAASLAFMFGAYMLRKNMPPSARQVAADLSARRDWRRAAAPLAMVAGFQLINSHLDILMVGYFRTDEEVGLYKVAVQFALLVIFGLRAIEQVIQPYYSAAYSRGDAAQLQKIATASARAMFFLGVVPTLVLLVFGSEILGVFFGNEYKAAYMALSILVIGQLVNAAFGSVVQLLNMTGNEKATLRGVFVAAICNIVLNILLVPSYGMEGAAFATAMTLFLWNFALYISVRKKLDIEPSIIGSRLSRKQC
ncbi:flippase [Alkalilimnicola ehrlichii]|uniref:flippase n=1 Tax=Alkalilimnicola ehrlichii TaxID=351052 RepID=UPI0015F29591|nr:flippase [Alkalilimnicola ehrlichii]